MVRAALRLMLILLAAGFMALPAQADDTEARDAPAAFHSSNLPLPRFASLSADEVYVRSGPGLKYPIKWVYKKPGLPVEIVLEYEVWRKIRDYEGQEGWVHLSLLSGKRTGVIQIPPEQQAAPAPVTKPIVPKVEAPKPFYATPQEDQAAPPVAEAPSVPVYQKPRESARWAAKAQPGAVVSLNQCVSGWCLVSAEGYKGWVERKFIWGIYESENFD